MIDLGTVRPGSTIRIPFSTFDKDDGSSVTMTNFAVADILIYKDGNTTPRASTSGFTATTDFASKTGKHVAIIDLSDNTTAGFYNAGSEYLVSLDAVTVDGVVVGPWIARFRIGYPGAVLDTTIASLSSQTSFTLTAGPAEDDALNGMWAVIHDIASSVQLARVLVLDYTGSTKTVTLAAGGTFTAASGDNISIIDMAPLQPTTTGARLDVTETGAAGMDWGNVENKTTTNALTATTISTSQTVVAGTVSDKTGYSLTSDYDPAKTASQAGDAMALTSSERTTLTGVIWAALTSGISTAGSIGKRIIDYLTGDIYTRIGSNGSGLTDLASQVSVNDLPTNAEFSSALATVSSDILAAINALNQSASRRIVLATQTQYERPESGTTVYAIELRTYDGDGAAVNADSTPTVTVTGTTSGSLAANLSAANNSATGVYEYEYSQSSSATLEPIKVAASAVIGGSTFTITNYTQSVDFVAANYSTADRTKLDAIYAKLPTNNIGDQTILASAISNVQADTDDIQSKIGTPAATLSADIAAVKSDTGNLVTRITSTLFSGITSLAQWLGLLAGKQSGNSTARTELRATGAGGGTYDEAFDSLEAVGDKTMLAASYTVPPTATQNRIEMDANSTKLSDIVADTGELQSDWVNGGRLDLILDSKSSQTSVDEVQSSISEIAISTGVLIAATGTVTDDAPTENGFKTDLTAGDGRYDDQLFVFTSGGLSKECKPVLGYLQEDGYFSFDEGFTAAPADGDQFAVVVAHIHPIQQIVDALTGDGITPAQATEMLVAFLNGKVSVSSSGGVSTYSYKQRDGSTTSFTSICSEINGTRNTTGAIP